MNFMEVIGLAISAYGVFGIFSGSIFAKRGFEMEKVERDQEPISFWIIVICYISVGQLIYWAMRYHLSHM
jgi:hypothetical protein